MIIVKVINQKVVQVAFATTSGHTTQAAANKFFRPIFGDISHQCSASSRIVQCRSLTQSSRARQKVTNSNQQQLIPIARNIYFRQCQQSQLKASRASAKASYSVIASNPLLSYSDAESMAQDCLGERVSTLENLKQIAKDAVERRELASRSHYYNQSFNEAQATTANRKLVVLMSWLEAQEKHIEKYRQFYLERGFDVLNVKTSSLDLLLPNRGAKKISKDFMRFMIEKQYNDVLYHGFSVGGYMFGQVMVDIDQHQPEIRNYLLGSIRGLIFDSLVPFEGTCVGVANSITQNKYLAKVLENCLRLYLLLGRTVATKYYEEASEKVWGGPLNCPTLFMYSKSDNIADYRIIDRLVDTWKKLGIEADKMVVDEAPHVQLFQKHNEAYVNRTEQFLKRIKLL